MSILVTLYSNVSHAYSVSGFRIQDSVLCRFPIFCAKSHLAGYDRLLWKVTKSFECLHSLSHKRKAERRGTNLLQVRFTCILKQEHVLGTPEITMKKIRPALCHSTLRSVNHNEKIVFTHGFNMVLNNAL